MLNNSHRSRHPSVAITIHQQRFLPPFCRVPPLLYMSQICTYTRFLGSLFKSVFAIGNSKTLYNTQNDNKLKKAMKMLLLLGDCVKKYPKICKYEHF